MSCHSKAFRFFSHLCFFLFSKISFAADALPIIADAYCVEEACFICSEPGALNRLSCDHSFCDPCLRELELEHDSSKYLCYACSRETKKRKVQRRRLPVATVVTRPLREVVVQGVLLAREVFPKISSERIVEGDRIPTIEEFRNFIKTGKNEQFKKFLPFFPLDEPDLYGNTFLHYAVSYQNEGALRHLLEKGADTTLKTFGSEGESPFQRAKKFCLTNFISIFKEDKQRRYQLERERNPFFPETL